MAGSGVPPAPFGPAGWCGNGHLQTIWGPLFRRDWIRSRRERVVLPDGDFVDLDWVDGPASPGAPRLLVLHGLEGSSRSHYAAGLMRHAAARGWRALTLNFRSCSGELNRRPQFYHSGHTDDLDHVVGLLLERDADAPIGVVGVSDRAVTARLHGFADEHDYWVRASSGPYLRRIHRPTLLISALDDPLVPPDALPDPSTLPPWVRTEFTPRGGHAGFIDGRWPWREIGRAHV